MLSGARKWYETEITKIGQNYNSFLISIVAIRSEDNCMGGAIDCLVSNSPKPLPGYYSCSCLIRGRIDTIAGLSHVATIESCFSIARRSRSWMKTVLAATALYVRRDSIDDRLLRWFKLLLGTRLNLLRPTL